MARKVVVVGGGIVGTAVAAELAAVPGTEVTVLEQGPSASPRGSTSHAPGYVGLFNEAPALTGMARASAEAYERLGTGGARGFDRVGCVEIATSAQAAELLEKRAVQATEVGLPSRLLDPGEACALAPGLVDPGHCVRGLHFPEDGTARAGVVTAGQRARSIEHGARHVGDAAVLDLGLRAGRVTGVRTAAGAFAADDVVVACGVWSPLVTAMAGHRLPLTPVAHPYVYGPSRPPQAATPFVRWPEHHVYARDHGDRLGLGSYDHRPRPVPPEELGASAELPWPGGVFDDPVARALRLLPEAHRFTPERRLNGIFAMTPDNLPFVGPLPGTTGCWVAAAIWVTHAAGAAQGLAALMTDRPPAVPGMERLLPGRFDGEPSEELEGRALRLYRDIYAAD